MYVPLPTVSNVTIEFTGASAPPHPGTYVFLYYIDGIVSPVATSGSFTVRGPEVQVRIDCCHPFVPSSLFHGRRARCGVTG